MIIGKEQLDLMRPATILINCARVILVDQETAYSAVKENRIWGYGLDEI